MSSKLRKLYRGICVEPSKQEEIVVRIRNQGLEPNRDDIRSVDINYLKNDLENLLAKAKRGNLKEDDTRPSILVDHGNSSHREYLGDVREAFFATSSFDGTCYYSNVHNKTDVKTFGIVICFKVPLESLIVDGRDFLFNSLSRIKADAELQHFLIKVYGQKLKEYIKLVAQGNNDVFAVGDLITNDDEIIEYHLDSKTWIKGRHGVFLQNSFYVINEIPKEWIDEISVDPPFRQPESYYDFYQGKHVIVAG